MTTRVTLPSGQIFEEVDGQRRAIEDQSPGYVVDTKPDLEVGRVLDWLSVASQDVAADADLLRRHSISRILNVAAGIELAPYPGFIYCHAPVLDLPEEPLADVLPRCFEFLDQAVDDGAGVLVHCNAGVSRSVSVVVAYLMSRRRMPFQEALDAVRAVRPAAKPNDGFLRQLKNYRP